MKLKMFGAVSFCVFASMSFLQGADAGGDVDALGYLDNVIDSFNDCALRCAKCIEDLRILPREHFSLAACSLQELSTLNVEEQQISFFMKNYLSKVREIVLKYINLSKMFVASEDGQRLFFQYQEIVRYINRILSEH